MPAAGISIDWTLSLGDIVVGVGTLLLALVTWSLAKNTARSVEALDLPFVIATSEREGAFNLHPIDPDHPDSSDVIWAVAVKLKNIGAGPAIVDGLEIRHGETNAPIMSTDWTWDKPISPGDETINQAVGLKGDPPEQSDALRVCVLYRSASGNHYVTDHEFKIGRNLGLHRQTFARRKLKG
jgi:hypothetical protein